MSAKRINISSGSKFEELYGYSRAVRVGEQLWIAGTTGYDYESMTLPADPAEQTRQIFRNLDAALAKAGSSRRDVVQTTTWLADAADWEQIGPVLGKEWGEVRPTNAVVVCGFPFPGIKVEIAVTAVIGCGG